MQTKEAGGLFVKREGAATRVPLRGVSIEASVTGVAARVSVAQRYQNLEKVPVEAVYSFPLDASAAVCGFEVEVGGKRIVGKVEEREKAFEKYDQAVAEGHGAFLVDQDRPNIFTASVGNLLPGQEVVVKLSYVSELPQTKDSLRVLIPTTISPRYIPPDQARTMDAAELDHLNPPVMLQVPYGLTLNVNIDAGSDIREIASLSHPAQVRVSGKTAQVSLVGQNIQLDQDFVLTVALADAHKPSAIVARDSAGVRAVMVNLIPDLSGLKRAPCEYLFIIDRSGSMDGPSIAQARSALQLALRSLDEGDYFNVIGFGTSYEPMFPASVAYDETTLTSAAAKVGTMEANLGGTEMLAPVRFALEAPRCGELPRQV
ncbi:MAG TPA: VIT and VWA domain-containing protein, partial [Vicinamibacterales bacterium]|nr:VIT and VWA domain-containing protein [Vicinamibacterales bacterium]